MADLILGPLLRHAERGRATIWLQTSAPCEVEIVTGDPRTPTAVDRTFTVLGHHYALVTVDDLPVGEPVPYRLRLREQDAEGGEDVWGWPGWPESVIRIARPDEAVRIAFGSCLAQGPQQPPYTIHRRHDPHGLGPDALRALALRVRDDPATRPDGILLLGDQVYADSAAPELREWIAERRSIDEPPGSGVADFAEYAELYRRTWSDPAIRWLLSTVPTSMIFDDHEIIDDWNISASWVDDIRSQPWWEQRITSGLAAYWVYEHLGNLPAHEVATDDTLDAVRGVADGGELLLERARDWDRGTAGTRGARWSYRREIGGTTILVVDSRNGRVLDPGGRQMIDDEEFAWLEEQAAQVRGHLLLASSVPWLLPSGLHEIEGWNEAVADGAWGRLGRRLAERIRRGLDLEHWAAFRRSWERLAGLIEHAVRDPDDDAPRAVFVLSGDVHYSYAASLQFDGHAHRPVWQLTSSPLRYPTPGSLERAFDIASTVVADHIGELFARLAGLEHFAAHWSMHTGPMHHNGVAELFLDGDRAHVVFWGAHGETTPRLRRAGALDLMADARVPESAG